MPKVLKRVLQVIGIILVVAIVVVGGYIIYLEVTYNHIADNVGVEVDNNPNANWTSCFGLDARLEAGRPIRAGGGD